MQVQERLFLQGHLRVYAWPEHCPDAALWWAWWQAQGPREQARLLVAEDHNLITSSGQTQLLNYLAQGSGTAALFAQYLSVGTGAISQVNASDVTMATEIFRATPFFASITGTTISVFFGFNSTDAVGTWTNAGIFGNGATSTLGTGTLLTHSLLSYVKNNVTGLSVQYNFTIKFS